MAYRGESLTERLERIKKQNAEIRLRHLVRTTHRVVLQQKEVEADKKMAKLSRALVHNHVTTSIKDMMPAERDAILNKNEPIESGLTGSNNMEKPRRTTHIYQPTVNKSKNFEERKPILPFNSLTHRVGSGYGSRSDKMSNCSKVPHSSNIYRKNVVAQPKSDDDDDDEVDLFQNVQDLKSDDYIVSEQVQLSGDEINHHEPLYVGLRYLAEEDFVPDSQKRLDTPAVPAPSESTPFFQFLSNMDFSVPPPPFVKEPGINVSIPPPNYNTNPGNSDFITPIYTSEEYNDIQNIYEPYSPLVGHNMMNPDFAANSLPSEAAPYPSSVASHRGSPPCGLLPPSNEISQHDNISGKYSNFQQDFSNPNEISAHGAPDYCNELPSIQLLEKALLAMGGNGQILNPQNLQRNLSSTPHIGEESVLNVSGIEIPKEVASDILKKALAIVSKDAINSDKPTFNSDITCDVGSMKMLQSLLQSDQNPSNGAANGRPILGRGARDQNVGGIEQASYHSHTFSDKPIDPNSRHVPVGYQSVIEDQNSNSSKPQQISYKQENCRYRPILGRTACDFEKNHQPPEPSTRHSSKNNKSMPVKKSNLLARMEAARNDTSHKFSRSAVLSQQKVGTLKATYQGRVLQSIDKPKSDSHLFPCSDVREKDMQIILDAKSHEDLEV